MAGKLFFVLAGVTLLADLAQQSAPAQSPSWIDTATVIVFSIMSALVGLVYNDMRKQIKDEAKAIGELRSEVKDLANLHGLLLGFAPGSGMVEELKMLKQREREITADILRLKIQFTLLEGIVNVQKIGNLKNDEEKLT